MSEPAWVVVCWGAEGPHAYWFALSKNESHGVASWIIRGTKHSRSNWRLFGTRDKAKAWILEFLLSLAKSADQMTGLSRMTYDVVSAPLLQRRGWRCLK